MTAERPKDSANPIANERTPIVAEARSSSYRATESQSEPSAAAAAASKPQDAVTRQRRKVDSDPPPANNDLSQDRDNGKHTDGWFRRTLEKYGAVELDNKGSTARDHLALERTFLAWLRTSLSFAGIGIAVTQLFRLNTTISDNNGQQPAPDAPASRLRRVGKPLGATFLAISVIVLLIGWRRYFESQYYIIKGKFPASRGSIFLTTFVAFALVVSTFVIVLVVDPSLFEAK